MCKLIENIADDMGIMADALADMSGLLSGGDDQKVLGSHAKLGPRTANVGPPPGTDVEHQSGTFYPHSADMGDNASLGNLVLDQQQETIVSRTLHLASYVAQNNQESIRRQIAEASVRGNKNRLCDKGANALFMSPLMTVVFVFLGLFTIRVVG